MKPHTGGSASTLCNSAYAMSRKMNDLVDETVKTGTERGLMWCIEKSDAPSDEIFQFTKPYETDHIREVSDVTSPVMGGKRHVDIGHNPVCTKGAGVALFHTHPDELLEFSNQDYYSALIRKASLNCLGTEKDGKKIITCDIITQNDNYEKHRKNITDTFNTRCNTSTNEYISALESGEPREIINKKYAKYMVGRDAMFDAIRDAIKDGVIKRCSITSNLSECAPPPLPPISERLIEIKRRYDSPDSSSLDYIDNSTGDVIGNISYSVWKETKEDEAGEIYDEKEGRIHIVEFDEDYPIDTILDESIEKILCDLKCKGVEKRVYVPDPQYPEEFEDLSFSRKRESSRTIETDISDIECECVTCAKSVTGIV